MSDFKAKIHQILFRRPRPRWGSLQRSPDTLAGFKGPTSKEKEERGRREGEGGKGKEGRGSPLSEILNTPLAVTVVSSSLSVCHSHTRTLS